MILIKYIKFIKYIKSNENCEIHKYTYDLIKIPKVLKFSKNHENLDDDFERSNYRNCFLKPLSDNDIKDFDGFLWCF